MFRPALWTFCTLVLAFLVLPTFVVIPLSLSSSEFLQFPPPGYTFRWYEEFFQDPAWMNALVRTVRVASGAMGMAVIIGTATAYGITRGRRTLASLVEPLFVLPMVVPVIVYAVGAYLIAIHLKLLGSLWLMSVAHATLALPFVVLNVAAALRTTDPRLELAAQTLGASRARAYLTITLPLTAPGVAAGALLAAVLSIDETVIALFLSPDTAPTLPVKMYSSIRYELDPLVPVASTIVILGTLMIGIFGLIIRTMVGHRWRSKPPFPKPES